MATALLHREHPEAEDFSLDEIRDRARREFHDNRPGVWQHIVSHCVASNRPNPAQYRMLQAARAGGGGFIGQAIQCIPSAKGKFIRKSEIFLNDIAALVDWYLKEYSQRKPTGVRVQPARGFGCSSSG